jgi:hypothetical protein
MRQVPLGDIPDPTINRSAKPAPAAVYTTAARPADGCGGNVVEFSFSDTDDCCTVGGQSRRSGLEWEIPQRRDRLDPIPLCQFHNLERTLSEGVVLTPARAWRISSRRSIKVRSTISAIDRAFARMHGRRALRARASAGASALSVAGTCVTSAHQQRARSGVHAATPCR